MSTRKKHQQSSEQRDAAVERKKSLLDTADKALDDLCAAMSAPEFERRMQERMRLMARLHSYSLNNQWLITWQLAQRDRTPSYVGGFHFWLKLNRVPRKSTGIYIMSPRRVKVDADADSDSEAQSDSGYRLSGFGTVCVFDYEDTDVIAGKEDRAAALFVPWIKVEGDYALLVTRLRSCCFSQGIVVRDIALPPGTNGTSDGKGTIMLSTRIAHDTAQMSKTLLHEMSHALVHKDRDGALYHADASYRARLECQADSIACACASALGLAWPNTPSYLALYQCTKEVLKANLDAIRAGVRVVLDAVLESEDDENRGGGSREYQEGR